MSKNPLAELKAFGQSIWLDYLRRDALDNGELQEYVHQDGVSGLTSNPSIFEKAIAGSHDYDTAIRTLAMENKDVHEIYQALTVEDIQRSCDLFWPIYDHLEGADGFASLEVSPKLAHDTEGTIAEARRLWAAVQRPNVMIKVPATKEGIPAIRRLTSEGINVNITLLFGLPRYREVIEAYISGLEARSEKGLPIGQISSVASFFLSRIDTLVDPMLEKMRLSKEPSAQMAALLRGQIAIASAKVAYQIYQEVFRSERFQKLAQKGARTQRLLWASTSTKNPEYSDVKYVDALIGPQTINTLPLATLEAYRDHGDPALRLEEGAKEARQVLEDLRRVGIHLDQVTQQLENDGVAKFDQSFDQLMEVLAEKRAASLKEPLDRQVFFLGEAQSAVEERIAALEAMHFSSRLWRKDAGLWKSDPQEQKHISNSLGWLDVAEKMEENLEELKAFKAQIMQAGFRHVLHMGMGGSSLTLWVFEHTFRQHQDALPLTVLDSTDPKTILQIESELPIEDTLFIVASKSGSTAETVAFGEYFYQKVREIKGERAGDNFCVITDPGAPIIKTAQERAYRKVFLNFADIGGRYSALSYFGLVPAILMGVDVEALLEHALRMVHACAACVPAKENPGLTLGAALGELAKNYGRNKVTFLAQESIISLGTWLEQLLAESTGKEGKGLLPVAEEPAGRPEVYGKDRVFVYIRLKDEEDDRLERRVAALREAGQPVISITMDSLLDLVQEFFRWEFATATAGAILGINPFDQPNVQESKDNTNRLLAAVQAGEELPEAKPSLVNAPLALYFQNNGATTAGVLKQFLGQARPGDYVALMAYVTDNEENRQVLQDLRVLLRKHLRVATTLGFGPRFLHSTGQFHKGGPNTGLFLQLTAGEPYDVHIPGAAYTFGVFKHAQALGDLLALQKHGRRVGRIDLGNDVHRGLLLLKNALEAALQAEQVRP